MNKNMYRLMIGGLLLVLVYASVSNLNVHNNAEAQTAQANDGMIEIDVPVRGTFLHAEPFMDINGDGSRDPPGGGDVVSPAIVDLQAHGISEGDNILISFSGEIDKHAFWDMDIVCIPVTELYGVFSTSADLRPISHTHRIPGAIDAGPDKESPPTWFRGEPTDIPEDFVIGPTGLCIEVPSNAKYLFICFRDSYYPDNVGSITATIGRPCTITGHVEDGYGHRLGGVEVTLFDVSSGSPTTTGITVTDAEGKYLFGCSSENVEPGKYQIEVTLECRKAAGETAIFSVNHDTGPSVRAQTDSFEASAGKTEKDIDFADPNLIPAAGIPQDRLDDLAGMYYHTKQVVDFSQSELGVTLDLNLPIVVHGYSSSQPGTAYYDPNDGNIYIGADRSDYSVRTKPWTPDWHEMFHQLMDDTVGIPPRHTGDTSHGGYANHCTGNSWVEGWAEFWPCALARSLGVPEWYLFWGTTSLEQNWMVWDSEAGMSREEFAVASLLVDLVDPVNPPEHDFLSLTNSQLWAIIGSKQLADMFEVYSALIAANIGQTDYDADGISDLDALFIAHGFFADDGNGAYDGETVGLGGKPGRQSTLLIPDAYLRIIVADSKGNPVSDGTLVVDVVFESPLDIYNYSYEVHLHGPDDLVYFEVAPERCDPLITMRVRDGQGNLSDEFTLSNSEYWEKVSEATQGYAAEHTFVIGGSGKSESGGVPVWVWPVVGGVVVALGAGGFFLLRRRAKPA